jgi:FtsP/CotA-like multicopper oxidase with cupredoxin domain
MRIAVIHFGRALATLALALAAAAAQAQAVVPGLTGPTFNLVTGAFTISTPDGDSLLVWGFGNGGGAAQLPGPTLIVNQGDTVVVNLTNNLPKPVSIVFPGQGKVTAAGGTPGLLTRQACAPSNAAPCGGSTTVTYSFTAAQPGTYVYHSGSQTELQVEMGLYGVIIVRPAGFDQATNRTAYGHPGTAYDHEYLFLLSEMDPYIHDLVDFGFADFIDNTTANPVFWFINGRNGADTLFADGAPSHPNQPYGALARTRPGEKVLLRLVNVGRNLHAFHPHGNHSVIVARDGRLLQSAPGAGPDLAVQDFTITPMPGGTVDALFNWTSKGLGWDIYGDPNEAGFQHTCNGSATPSNAIDPASGEDCNFHGVRLDGKVVLPGLQDVAFGGWYSGSPFLGHFGQLPPGEGGLNLNGGLFFMWHSHNEKELTNFDIFPGGMMTFVVIEPPGTPIP